jgi:mercuric ion transport protein
LFGIVSSKKPENLYMGKLRNKKSFSGLAVLTAIAASLCCITPVLAFIAGVGGMASTFSWMEPFRPYLAGLTIGVLGFAWYQKLKPAREIDCDCDEEKGPFMQSKMFLAIITLFAGLMLVFPYYGEVFYPNTEQSSIQLDQNNLETIVFNIEGMTCSSCEEHVHHSIIELGGIHSASASYEQGQATIQFDKTKTDVAEITKAINATGYQIKD